MFTRESVYCIECGDYHPNEIPHNVAHPHYQKTFFKKQGRFPTWSDAMSHCTEEMKLAWKTSMTRVRRSSGLLMD